MASDYVPFENRVALALLGYDPENDPLPDIGLWALPSNEWVDCDLLRTFAYNYPDALSSGDLTRYYCGTPSPARVSGRLVSLRSRGILKRYPLAEAVPLYIDEPKPARGTAYGFTASSIRTIAAVMKAATNNSKE